jgi:hypothetical protein
MALTSPRLAVLAAFFVLTLSAGYVLFPFAFGMYPPLAQASPLSMHTRSITGTVAVSETVTFARHSQVMTDRYEHQATLLSDGSVLLTGGLTNSTGLNTAEVYEPGSQAFRPTGNMTFGRVGHTATLLHDGRVLVVGARCVGHDVDGCDGPDNNAADLYDPATGVFTPTGSTSDPRRNHTATRLPDGRVLVTGGACPRCFETCYCSYPLSTAEIYDPTTERFTSTGSMSAARMDHTATLLPDGKVLIVGGSGERWAGTWDNPLVAELYDPATGEFTRTGSLHYARWPHTATLLPDDRVLIAGGSSPAEIYDPSTGNFELISMGVDYPLVKGSMLLPTGTVLLVGARDGALFDPATDTFWSAGTLVDARGPLQVTPLPDDRILVTGNTRTGGKWSEIGSFVPSGTFTGVLTLPSERSTSHTVEVAFSGESLDGSLEAGAVHQQPYATTWNWLPLSEGEEVTTTYTFNQDGAFPLSLRLRDVHGRTGIVVTGMVQVDTGTRMFYLPLAQRRYPKP